MLRIIKDNKYNKLRIRDLLYLEKEIDFSPEYQRKDEIWTPDKQNLLIDSIINGYDMPKFYFHYNLIDNSELNDSNKRFAVIDGKQRLTAILKFLKGEIKLNNKVKSMTFPDLDFNGKTFNQLKKNKDFSYITDLILDYILDVVLIETSDLEMIEEMFLRLNEGVPVNNAEKRNSIGGFLIEAVKDYSLQSEFLIKKVRFSNRRLEHHDLLIKLALMERNRKDLINLDKKNLDSLVKEFKPSKKDSKEVQKIKKEDAYDLVHEVGGKLERIGKFFNNEDPILRYKGVITLYYAFFNKIDNVKNFRNFVSDFESARKLNRKSNDFKNTINTLTHFDRLNQQGAHQAKSLKNRLTILDFYYQNYLKGDKSFRKEIDLKKIGIELTAKTLERDEIF